MVLRPARDGDLVQLMDWFSDARALLRWGGPQLSWPLEAQRFAAEVQGAGINTRICSDPEGRLIAFGQFYRKLDRCHLARIAVAPERRGGGLGVRLVQALMSEGGRVLGTHAWSLYVLDDNAPAIASYRACGFRFAEDPEPVPQLPNCLFMIVEPRSR